MEKLNFFDKIARAYSKLTDKEKLSYMTLIIIIALASVIIYYERKEIRIENEHAIYIDKLNSRTDMLLGASEERVRDCQKNFNAYLERNEKEVRELLFKYEDFRQKQINK